MQTHSPGTRSTPVLNPTPGSQDGPCAAGRARARAAGGSHAGRGSVPACCAPLRCPASPTAQFPYVRRLPLPVTPASRSVFSNWLSGKEKQRSSYSFRPSPCCENCPGRVQPGMADMSNLCSQLAPARPSQLQPQASLASRFHTVSSRCCARQGLGEMDPATGKMGAQERAPRPPARASPRTRALNPFPCGQQERGLWGFPAGAQHLRSACLLGAVGLTRVAWLLSPLRPQGGSPRTPDRTCAGGARGGPAVAAPGSAPSSSALLPTVRSGPRPSSVPSRGGRRAGKPRVRSHGGPSQSRAGRGGPAGPGSPRAPWLPPCPLDLP